MEFLRVNYLTTSTQIAVNSNTSTASNLFSKDPFFQYFSEGLNDDNTTSSITITFDATTMVSRIALMDTNAKAFMLYYNGSTSNTFALQDANTTSSAYAGNADENIYFRFPTTACTSITLETKATQTANQEKRLGQLVISDLYFRMSHIPNASGYKPSRTPKQIVHRLSDGGTRVHNVRKKWEIDIRLKHLNQSDRDSLKEIYDLQDAFIFSVFGTATGWDGILFEAVWPGEFDFYEFSDDAIAAGFSGKISLRETPA